jgi:hypothetical protein
MKRLAATLSDAAMCGMMYVLQRRHRLPPDAAGKMERYLAAHAHRTRRDYFDAGRGIRDGGDDLSFAIRHSSFTWPESAHCHVVYFEGPGGASAPTVLMLHALMSASDRGYREWARRFNERGWNAAFIHLPYHYTRTPRRHLNGELAITADVVRTAEGIRAGVAETRQLMAALRARGCREFGLWACSYGGWMGALLAGIEEDFRWCALIEPIVDLSDALWRSPAAAAVRAHLRAGGITPEMIARFHPLVCPGESTPLCGGDRVLFAAGEYDRIARVDDLHALHARWRGSELLTEPQGHFGFRLMRAAWAWLERRGLLA